MSLTINNAPFGPRRAGSFNFDTGALKPHTLYMEESQKRVRAVFGGQTIADSRRAALLHETAMLPVYYFPEEDLNSDLLRASEHTTYCPFKGEASYRSVVVGEKVAENAVWSYPDPTRATFEPGMPPLTGYAAIYFGAMDHWYEEDEEIFVHPRDPYTRIEVLESSRHVRVSVAEETVARTQRPKILYETGLPPRYYLPPEDVSTELLTESETRTACPYKGEAAYYSVEAGGRRFEDAAFSYPDPKPEAQKVADHLCFLGEDVTVEVDGEIDPDQ